MLVAALIAALGLAIVAGSARPGDGRAETAVAIPLAAAVAVASPAAALALLAGAALAFGTETAVARRRLMYGRRLRAIAAASGAVVPLGVLVGGAALGATPAAPELWIAGAVVPGVLADDVHRQPPDTRGAIAIGGTATFLALALSGVVLAGAIPDVAAGKLLETGTGIGAGASAGAPLAVLATVLLLGVGMATGVRWRYGLAIGVVSLPLVAVWSLGSPAVAGIYLVGGVASALVVGALQPRLCLPSRQLSASVGLLGALIGTVLGVLAGAGLPAVVAGVLAAEDARVLRRHTGGDLLDALALGVALVALVAGAVALGSAGGSGAVGGLAIASGVGVGGLVVARRERERPTEQQLRAAERRWAP